jgi:transposase
MPSWSKSSKRETVRPISPPSARILLLCEQGEGGPRASNEEIARLLAVSRQTVIRTRKRFGEGGLEAALVREYPQERPQRRRLDGAGEAALTTVACSKAPDGHERWTIRLLASRLVELHVVESISPETVRQTLKKTNSSRG